MCKFLFYNLYHKQVFEEIRDRHFSNVFGFLSAKAKELQAGYDVSVS